MRDWPHHEDLGLINDDQTEDMRKAPAATEALLKRNNPRSHHNHIKESSPMTIQSTNDNPPARRRPLTLAGMHLDTIWNLLHCAATDADKVIGAMPAGTPIFAAVDLITARQHMRQAAILVDRVAEQIDTGEALR